MAEFQDLAETMRAILASQAQEIRVGFFARITEVHSEPGTPLVDVQPVVREPVEGPEGEPSTQPLPVLQRLPVLYLQGGPFGVSFPLTRGGTVYVMVSAQDFSQWFLTGRDSDPLHSRGHALSNAVALPVGFSLGNGLMVDATALVVHASAIKLGSHSAALRLAVAELVDERLSVIRDQFNGHTHVAPPMGGATAVPVPLIPALSSVASGTVKVDS